MNKTELKRKYVNKQEEAIKAFYEEQYQVMTTKKLTEIAKIYLNTVKAFIKSEMIRDGDIAIKEAYRIAKEVITDYIVWEEHYRELIEHFGTLQISNELDFYGSYSIRATIRKMVKNTLTDSDVLNNYILQNLFK